MRKTILLLVLSLVFWALFFQASAGQNSTSSDTSAAPATLQSEQSDSSTHIDWDKRMPWILTGFSVVIAFLATVFGFFQYVKRHRDTEDKTYDEQKGIDKFNNEQKQNRLKSEEERYNDFLREELGTIGILGASKIGALQVKLLESYVSLELSETVRTEEKYNDTFSADINGHENLTPELVIKRAFSKFRMLLIIGDPGSGKTTLLKYYTISILEGKYLILVMIKCPCRFFCLYGKLILARMNLIYVKPWKSGQSRPH